MNIILILSSVLLNCFAQIVFKKAMLGIGMIEIGNLAHKAVDIISNLWIWLGLLSMGSSVLIWFVVLSRVPVGYAYAFTSLGYIIVTIGGYYFFSESISTLKILGLIVICVGFYISSRG